MSKNRIQTFLTLVVIGIGLLLTFIAGLHIYMTSTPPLHQDAQSVSSVTQSKPSREWTDAVEQGRQIARAGLTEQNLPGLSVAVGIGRDIVWAEGFGWADLENRVPVSPNLRFRIGTASTVLTSAAVGLLIEKGQLKLDDEIQTYVKDFPKKEWPVTLRQLMGHLAGVRTDGGDEGPLFSQRCERPGDALPSFADRSLLFEPGTRYRYSSYGWILMSAAVEAAADDRFFRFMRTNVFEPLGMADTRPDFASDEIPDRAARAYFPRYSADPSYGPDPMREIDLSCYAGASVFVSTPSDLVRFGMAINGGKLLQPATVQLLQNSQRLPSGEETGYGLGWDLEPVTLAGEPTRVVGHDGDVLGGTVASFMTFPERGIVVAVLSNTSYADTFAIGLRIAEAFALARSEAPGKARADRRDRNDPFGALLPDHDPTIGEERQALVERHLEPTAEEHRAYLGGGVSGEDIVHVQARHACSNSHQSVRPDATATECRDPQLGRPEQQRSAAEARDDVSIMARPAREMRSLEVQHDCHVRVWRNTSAHGQAVAGIDQGRAGRPVELERLANRECRRSQQHQKRQNGDSHGNCPLLRNAQNGGPSAHGGRDRGANHV